MNTIRGSLRRRLLARLHSERGQVVAITVGVMFVMLGLTAFTVDVGPAFQTHRRAQAAADASALGGAQMLPNTSVASEVSAALAAKNLPGGTVSPAYSSTYSGNDTITATATAASPSFFAKVFGIQQFNTTATATARIGSYTGWSKSLEPWVTDKQTIKWGELITFKVDPGNNVTPGNFGGARLSIKESSCGKASGGDDYRQLINNTKHSCRVDIGSSLDPETGNMNGPTKQGLNERTVNGQHVIQGFDPYSILQQQPDGSYVLTTYEHPNLIVIPVIDSFHNGTSTPFKVVGFAWFIITSYTQSGAVSGMFISSAAPSGVTCPTPSDPYAGCPVGGYDPSGYSFKTVQFVA